MSTHKAFFFDRDGVINKSFVRNGKPYPPGNIEEFEFNQGIFEVMRKIKEKGHKIFVVTNQPDVKTGVTSRETVEAFHSHIKKHLPVEEVFTCFHTDEDECDCRKPRPGMIKEAIKRFDINEGESFLIGDRWRDIEAGKRAHLKTVFIDYGYLEKRPDGPDFQVKNIIEFNELLDKLLN